MNAEKHHMPRPGGQSFATTPSDEDIQLFKGFQAIVEEKAGQKFTQFDPVLSTRQVVAGMNYRIRYEVAPETFVDAKIFVPLRNQPQVTDFKSNTQKESSFDI